MKYIKIIALIAITSIYSSEIMFSRSGGRSSGSSRSSSRPSNIGSGTKQIGGASGMQKTNLQDNTGKKGALAVGSKNNQQGPSGDHAAGGAALARGRNNVVPATTDDTSDDSSSDQTAPAALEAPVAQAAPAEPVMADQNNDEIPDSPAAIAQEPSIQTMVSTVVPHQAPAPTQQAPQESHAVTTSTEQSSEDILKKLKTLETIETKTDALLQNSSVDLLFNNFVHLKEFITKNFEKEKMLNLCKELINQMYPAEKEVIKVAQEPAQPTEQPAAPATSTPSTDTQAASALQSAPEDQTPAPAEQSESAQESDDSQGETEENSSEGGSEESAA